VSTCCPSLRVHPLAEQPDSSSSSSNTQRILPFPVMAASISDFRRFFAFFEVPVLASARFTSSRHNRLDPYRGGRR
jgi:hypothetical protein